MTPLFTRLSMLYQLCRHQNRLAKKKELYIYEQYNVHCFTANLLSVVRNVATLIVNAFIKALNDYNFLLHFVLVMPNMDITKIHQTGRSCISSCCRKNTFLGHDSDGTSSAKQERYAIQPETRGSGGQRTQDHLDQSGSQTKQGYQ